VKDEQTLPSVDTDFDDNLLVAKTGTSLKKVIRFQKGNPKLVWRSYVFNDRKCKTFYKKNSVQSNVKTGV
jgi:hypothetical protein